MFRRGNGALVGAMAFAFVVSVSLAPAAAAAEPFVLDPNPSVQPPKVAIDDRGTAHVVWNEDVPDGDDIAHYCKVPRGARACTRRHQLPVPGQGLGLGPWALARDGETVIVISGSCCDNDHFIYAWVSEDGGESFGGRRQITGTRTWGWSTGGATGAGPVLGPGPFAVSIFAGNAFAGLQYQAAPLDGIPEGQMDHRANLGPGEFAYGTGFIDALTPIVAFGEFGSEGKPPPVYFRRFAGGADHNNGASWGPRTFVGFGEDAKIASLPSGRRGVHILISESGKGFVHRRFDGQKFANATRVSPADDTGRLQDFFLDASGKVHALWTDRGTGNVRHRTSADGVKWGKPKTLLADYYGGAYSFRADAACDGGGLGVFRRAGEASRALAFGPTGAVNCEAGPGGCIEAVKVGSATRVEAQEGCFTRKGSTYTSAGDVRVNGIDLRPGAAGATAAAKGAKVVVDRAARTLKTTAAVEARVGNVVLGRQQLGWKLPAGTGEIRDLAGNPAKLDTAKFGSELFGLPVSGYVVPRIVAAGKGALTSNLALPSPFTGMLGGGSSAESILRFDNAQGLALGDGLEINVKDASIGIAGLGPFELSFSAGTSSLRGRGELKLPVVNSGLETEFQITGGAFDYGRASLNLEPPVGPIPLGPNVFLHRIDFSMQAGKGCETPTKISAGGRITVMPGVAAGAPLLDVDPLSASYSFPIASCGKPGIFALIGKGKLINLVNANLEATYKTSGQFNFGAGLDFDLEAASASIGVEGGVDLNTAHFYALGTAQAELFSFELPSAEVLVSSIGVAACGPAPPIPPPINPLEVFDARGGFEYRWGETFRVDWPSDCDFDLDALIPATLKPGAAAAGKAGAAAQSAEIAVGKGESAALIQITGKDEAPGFVLTGPGGLRIEHGGEGSDPVGTAAYDVYPAPSAKLTNVRIKKPAAGTYTVADVPGEDKIVSVEHATALPAAKVKAKVAGKGAKRTLRYNARKIAGQTILFVEQGPGGVRDVIGTARKPKGKLSFRPGPGPKGKRQVLAIVAQRGSPRAELGVASYKAPGDQRPGKVRKLRLKRKRGKLVVSWRRAAGAKRHVVAWKLRDGRRGSTTTKKRKLTIAKVPGIDAGSIRVAGIRADNVAGKVAKAKLKPKPKKRGKGKKRKKGKKRR